MILAASSISLLVGLPTMIESLVSETEWIEVLGALPGWQPPRGPMLVIAPHPDDETLGAGGLIASQRALGIDVTVVAVTDGENAYLDTDPGVIENLRRVRRQEQTNALGRLGVPEEKIVRFSLTDSGVTAREEELIQLLEPLITRGTHVISPWTGDFHPDHESCGRAAAIVAEKAGAQITSYFFWAWHRGTPELLMGPRFNLQLGAFRFDEEILRAKTEALLCHRSQLERTTGDEILPASLLGPARRKFEVFAHA
jgi:LmbE family N-acetylglucosaminyl deacetylase